MQRRPIIGIPTQDLMCLGSSLPAGCPPSWIMSHRYVLTLTSVGAVPWLIPSVADDEPTLRAIYDSLDGVFLPGGADIDPSSYGEARHPRCDPHTDPPRDHTELALTRWAAADRKPVLGVCRGLQLMNILFGGTLWQDLADERPRSIKHDYFPFGMPPYPRDHLAHTVQVVEQSWLGEIVGASEIKVNSMHHQGVKELAASLVCTAVAPDGLIEAAELPGDQFMVGVQWHPEALNDKDAAMHRLFQAFVDAAGEFRETRLMSDALV